jgi:hypothetical protein
MLQLVDASFKDINDLVDRMKEDKVCFVGKTLIQVSTNIERYVARLKECIEAQNVPRDDNQDTLNYRNYEDAKILVEVKICDEFAKSVEEFIAPQYISCAMLVGVNQEYMTSLNPADFVTNMDDVKLLTGYSCVVDETFGDASDIIGNAKAFMADISKLKSRGTVSNLHKH